MLTQRDFKPRTHKCALVWTLLSSALTWHELAPLVLVGVVVFVPARRYFVSFRVSFPFPPSRRTPSRYDERSRRPKKQGTQRHARRVVFRLRVWCGHLAGRSLPQHTSPSDSPPSLEPRRKGPHASSKLCTVAKWFTHCLHKGRGRIRERPGQRGTDTHNS